MVKSIFKSLLLVCLIGVVCGFDIPNYEWYVTDKVGIFSETEKADLTSKIQEIEQATSIEVAVLVVPTVDDDINLAAVDVGNKRGVGKEGQNNGLMILIAINDRKWSIQVGYGLEWTIPDLIAKNIGEVRFPSNFRAGNYYQGVVEMLDDVLLYIKNDPTIVQNYSQISQETNGGFDEEYLWLFLLVLFFGLSAFGRWVTVPSVKGTWRKMRKGWRRIFVGTGVVVSLLVTWIIANILLSVFLSYAVLLVGLAIGMFGKTWWKWGIRYGWTWRGFWWWGWWSFGGFGWWSFGGWGWWGSR